MLGLRCLGWAGFWLREGQWDGCAEQLEGMALGGGGFGEGGHEGCVGVGAVLPAGGVLLARTGAAGPPALAGGVSSSRRSTGLVETGRRLPTGSPVCRNGRRA